MKIGIVAPPKAYKRGLTLKRIFRVVSIEELKILSNPFDLVIGEIPILEEKLKTMPRQKLERWIVDAKNKLRRFGTEEIVFTDFIKTLCHGKGIFQKSQNAENGDLLFLKMLPGCIRETAKKCSIDLMNEGVCIRESKAGRISEYLMQELCFDTKTIVLATKDPEGSKKVCNHFFEETGLFVKTVDFEDIHQKIVLDVDLKMVRFRKDLYVNAVDMGFDMEGYGVRQRDILSAIKGYTPKELKWEYRYK